MTDHHLAGRLLGMTAEELRRQAFGWPGGSMSLGELRDGMLRFAGWLGQAAPVLPGERVAVCLPKSAEALVAMCGILAAGAAYVPLQYRGPPARLASILASVGARLLVTTPEMAAQLGATGTRLVEVEPREDGSGLEALLRGVPPRRDVAQVGPDDLAWLIFTSGSTGEPKGVMLSHRNLETTVSAMARRDRLTDRDVRVSHAPLHYLAAFDLLLPLICGARIFLLSEREAMFPERVAEVLEAERSTVWSSSATALRLILERGGLERRDLGAMRRMSFYGEPMPMSVLRRLMAALPATDFSNHYASTEAGAIAYFDVPRPLPDDLAILPLGRPAEHCVLTLRDDTGAEVGPGETGEICITGSGVTLGYWNDPELTAARRVEGRRDSFRSGDFGVIGVDGLLYSAGRADQMVKLRGHRLDLGEVESVLRTHPGLRDAVVFSIPLDAQESEIRAVVLTVNGIDCELALRSLCRLRLPGHAQPARIIALPHFPLLPTGKVDRQALRGIAAGGPAKK